MDAAVYKIVAGRIAIFIKNKLTLQYILVPENCSLFLYHLVKLILLLPPGKIIIAYTQPGLLQFLLTGKIL